MMGMPNIMMVGQKSHCELLFKDILINNNNDEKNN